MKQRRRKSTYLTDFALYLLNENFLHRPAQGNKIIRQNKIKYENENDI